LQKPEKRGDATPPQRQNDSIIVIAKREAPKQSHLTAVLHMALVIGDKIRDFAVNEVTGHAR